MLRSLEEENEMMVEVIMKLDQEKLLLEQAAQDGASLRVECERLSLEVQRLKALNESSKPALCAPEDVQAEQTLQAKVKQLLLLEREARERDSRALEEAEMELCAELDQILKRLTMAQVQQHVQQQQRGCERLRDLKSLVQTVHREQLDQSFAPYSSSAELPVQRAISDDKVAISLSLCSWPESWFTGSVLHTR